VITAGLRETAQRLLRRDEPNRVVREYGRDSLLVWANLLLAPVFSALGLRVGIQSEEQLATRIERDIASMRERGYLVASVETFALKGVAGPATAAHWYRVTFEKSAPPTG
jgi:hypothetical protein